MRISELSRVTGVPIPTIKFYLRERLLPAGKRTAANQASYDAGHVRRLELIRVLVEVGGLGIGAVRGVLAAIGRKDASLHEILAEAHRALRRADLPAPAILAPTREETDAWLDARGWALDPASPPRDDLAATLLALRQLGWEVGPEIFERYADAADAVASAEVDHVASIGDREAAVRVMVIGTILFERALLALRRLAHEHHSRTRLTEGAPGGATRPAAGSE